MNILVVGCGKVGSRLASVLSRQGHDVSVVAKDADSFEALAPEFSGYTTRGVPIDQDVLKRAGIESCDAVAAVTLDDNINIMVSELAREIFHVKIVLARIYDPRRGDVFSHFGLHTVCPTNLTVAAVCSALTEEEVQTKTMNIGSHTLTFATMDIPKEYYDKKVSEIVFEKDEILYAVERESTNLILVGLNDMVLKRGDRLVFSKLVD
ncbi:MAG: TrkA family potassium uptake protein [Oscillospiraceae bacterium]